MVTKQKRHSFDDLEIGQEFIREYVIDENELMSFSSVSGDYNKLHHEKKFAQKKGFKDIVIHGALVISKLSGILGMEFPGEDCILSSINIKFSQPIYVNERFYIKLNVKKLSQSVSMIVFDLEVISNERLKYFGEVSVLNKE